MKSSDKNNDIIAATSTPTGHGGVGIIKISGRNALSTVKFLFRPGGQAYFTPESHKFYYGYMVSPETEKKIDEVFLVYMKEPRSYTREDVVEIHAHAGPVVLNLILKQVLGQGARLAEPGEFTKRAFLNGRIDLTRAESVIDIINAKSEKALDIANAGSGGRLFNKISDIRADLTSVVAELEASIDFAEDVAEDPDFENLKTLLFENVISPLGELIERFESTGFYRDGIRLAIVGRPNVGKSSLMNRLLDDDRMIVSDIPGTTRDLVQEPINIKGLPLLLIDTAGFHDTDDPIESQGLLRTKKTIDSADLILFLLDVNDAGSNIDTRIVELLEGKKSITIFNMIDLVDEHRVNGLLDEHRLLSPVFISALYNKGIGELKEKIVSCITGDENIVANDTIVPNIRHISLLERAGRLVEKAIQNIDSGVSPELVVIDLGEALSVLGEIIGLNINPDVLDLIFSRFCIGK
ncbi:MAG: tRNA uridine-5-carboxymethylaminomethyl(34) synthesis GTPase MnmE [Desulfobacterales bacterium]|nr:tRNA uridine-5-carboxymethylaminomethyl(34) synthesis GTPase MnmE [Desulfobacterales bacterium]